MFVTKRGGRESVWMPAKFYANAVKLADGLNVNVEHVLSKLTRSIVPGITTNELLEESARTAAQMVNTHPDYGILAGRWLIARWRKSCPASFSDCILQLASQLDPDLVGLVAQHKDTINAYITPECDDKFSYFAVKTLERAYLLKVDGTIVETPQYMYMRVALGVHGDDLFNAFALYTALSEGCISHASPTLFNAGTKHPQLASCFLMSMDGDQDSIKSIYSTLGKCADISKYAGGIGLHVHTVRAAGSFVRGTNGTSNGLVPMLRVFDATAKYVDQGGNKRPGAMAIYLEPWHADIFAFLELKLPTGVEELRARDLFYGLWVPDLFMKRVNENLSWTLFDPKTAPGLEKVWGLEFETLYGKYEQQKLGVREIPARELWARIIRSQRETGTPYMLYKDHCNRKSNQQHMGTISSSNLCVSGDTLITTRTKGPVCIKELAEGPDVTRAGEGADAYNKTAAQIKALQAKESRTPDEEQTLAIVKIKLASMQPPPTKTATFEAGPVEVWNGHEWSEVVPKKTGSDCQLMRITTSHGTVLDCTPEHKFLLPDDSRISAQNLKLGTALKPITADGTPVIYDGDEAHVLSSDVAFRRGFVFAYAIIKSGSATVTQLAAPQLKVPMILVSKESVLADVLRVFAYDEAWAISQFPDIDHTLLAACVVPPTDQSLQTRLSGPLATRKKWVDGFLAGLGGQVGHARGSYAFLHKAWLMMRSIGFDVRLEPVDTKGLWNLKAGTLDRNPVVTGLQYLPGKHDTYCFTEPKRNAGVFNELLTGQCAEIIEYSDPDQIAVCNLASICLPHCIAGGTFDFDCLRTFTRILVQSLNKIIDRTMYVRPEMQNSNLRHRPIGIGVQGLADVFAMLKMPWESAAARELNKDIFEHMYAAALEESMLLAKEYGPYESFQGSPASRGQLQFDFWPESAPKLPLWPQLKADIQEHGLRNSLLLACMPTASTAQILGNNESIEPFTSNIYTRSVLSGEFQVVNRHLVQALQELNLWNEETLHTIVRHNGSVQQLDIPDDIKAIFKTVWEIPQRLLMDMAADRGAYICQSQSLNLHMRAPTDNQLYNAHFHAWEKGLKTGMYYLRTRPAVDPIKFTLTPENAAAACSRENREACTMCSA